MFYVNYVIFLPLFAEKNPNKVANFFILNNGEFLRHSFPPSQANSLAIFSFVEFLNGELRHISILKSFTNGVPNCISLHFARKNLFFLRVCY